MTGRKNQYTGNDVTLSFVTQSYPQNLIKHLKDRQQISVEKICGGIYYINGEIYCTQLIVMNSLSAEEYRYMRCLYSLTQNQPLFDSVVKDCSQNHNHPVYDSYANELLHAASEKKEDVAMCEAIFELFGTSSEEIAANATKEAEIKIHDLTLENASLSDEVASLSDEIASLSDKNASLLNEISRLRTLLAQKNVE